MSLTARPLTRPRLTGVLLVAAAVIVGLVVLAAGQFLELANSAVPPAAADGAANREPAMAHVPTASPGLVMDQVGALGRLEPRGEVINLAPPSGVEGARIEALHVALGDRVAQGDLVATFDAHNRRQAALKEAQARVEVARARLSQVEAGAKPAEIASQSSVVDRLQAYVAYAEQELRRGTALREKSAITDAELEWRQTQHSMAVRDWEKSVQQLAAVKEVRLVDVDLARAELLAAEARADQAAAELDCTVLRSPREGTVLKILAWPGERVAADGVVELADIDHMLAIAEVYEADAPRVRVGQSAKVFVRNLGWELSGEVCEVGRKVGKRDVLSTDPVNDVDARVVEVKVALTPTDSARVAGLTNLRCDVVLLVPPEPQRNSRSSGPPVRDASR